MISMWRAGEHFRDKAAFELGFQDQKELKKQYDTVDRALHSFGVDSPSAVSLLPVTLTGCI